MVTVDNAGTRPGFTVAVLGTVIGVDVDARSLPEQAVASLRAPWQAALTDHEPQVRVWCALDSQAPVPDGYAGFVRSSELNNLIGQLRDNLVGEGLAGLIPDSLRTTGLAQLPDVVGVRAGAIALETGAIVLAGRTYLHAELAALARTGGYLGDRAIGVSLTESMVLPALTPVTGYPGGTIGSRRELPPSELGLRPVSEPVPLQAVVVLESGTDEAWEPLSVPLAVARLAPTVPLFPALPHPMQDLARLAGLVEGAVRIRYADPNHLPGLLAEALAEGPAQPLTIPVEPGAGEAVSPTPGAVRRTPMLDGISDGATMALCRQDRTVVGLAGLGPLLWDLAREWIAPEDLLRAVVARVDAPGHEGEVHAAAAAALDALVEQRALTQLV